MDKHLHIVCLDVPYPPDYGGAVDMFYKIKFLSGAGIKIILHCFEYGRERQKELERYCEQVYYYKRKKTIPLRVPYIVSSRKDKRLIGRLLNDAFPVLLEGIHCTYYLYAGELKDKDVWVRMHNVESEYYANLSMNTRNLIKRGYYKMESRLLSQYERYLFDGTNLLAISEKDLRKVRAGGVSSVDLIPLFIDKITVSSRAGRGGYCLYHGNLSVAENEAAVLFIANEIAPYVDARFVIAGKKPGRKIRNAAVKNNIQLIENPDDVQLDQLLKNAHVNLFPFFNMTGVKVKLIHALFKGRFVVTNIPDSDNRELAGLSIFARTEEDFRRVIPELLKMEFSRAEINKRKEVLEHYFDPTVNAQRLINLIFN